MESLNEWSRMVDIAAQVPALAVLAYLVWQLNRQGEKQLAILAELVRTARETTSREDRREGSSDGRD